MTRSISAPRAANLIRRDVLETEKQLNRRGPSPVLWILCLAVLLGAGGYFYLQRVADSNGPAETVLTEEARAYYPNLDLANVEMQAKEDALGQTLLEITGEITNKGDRTCSRIGLYVIFLEINGVEVDRQLSQIVNSRTGPLEPGETQPFRLAFDEVSPDWNQAFPKLSISEIQFD